jgi:signal transduction histidine kinase
MRSAITLLLACLLYLSSAAAFAQAAKQPCDQLQTIHQAQRIISQNGTPIRSEQVSLPDTLPLAVRNGTQQVRYRIDLGACAGSGQAFALYAYRVGAPYSVKVDALGANRLISSALPHTGLRDVLLQSLTAGDYRYNGRVPAVFGLPAHTTELDIVLATLPYMPAGLTPLAVGSDRSAAVQQSTDYAYLSYGSDIVAGLSAFFGLLALLLSHKRKRDFGMRWFAFGSLIWGLRNLLYLNPTLAGTGFASEVFLSYGIVASGSALVACSLYVTRSTHPGILRFIRWLLIIVTAAAALGLTIPLFALAARGLGFFAVMALLIWATWRITKATRQPIRGVSRTVQYVMALGIALQLILGLHDFGIVLGFRPATSVALVFWGYSCWVLSLAALSSARVVEALNRANNAKQELEVRVAEKNAELESFYESARQAELVKEREAARSQERSRLNREIHDGVGAQLMVALRGVERDALSKAQITESLQDGLDELRLLMDSADVGRQLQGALAAWRNRWDPRLTAIGMALSWHVAHETETVELAENVVLQLMRILQEAVTNAIKHSQGNQIAVRVDISAALLTLCITDNGVGISSASVDIAHRGVHHIHQRSEQIGAMCTIQALGQPLQGTEVKIELKLPSRAD